MKKIALLLSACFVLFLASEAGAQNYKKAIGVRLGVPIAASFKFFISDPGAIEVYAGFRSYSVGYNWFSVGAMYQHHFPIGSVDGLSWYIGGGASVWFFNYDFATDENGTSFAINAVGGVDYKLPNAPFNFSADWTPTFQISGFGSGFSAGYFAVAARYVLGDKK